MKDKSLILKGITIAVQAVDMAINGFNPNDESCYRMYNRELCKTFCEAMFELTGISGTMIQCKSKSGANIIICKYRSYYIDISTNVYVSKFKPKGIKPGG